MELGNYMSIDDTAQNLIVYNRRMCGNMLAIGVITEPGVKVVSL